MTLIGSIMSAREGHGSAVRVEVDLGPSLEVNLGPSLEDNLGLVLEVSPEIGQEPEVKAITVLTPRISVPVPQTTTGNPLIGE